METRANHVLIGAFVLVSLLASLAFVVWKSDVTGSGDRRGFVILFDGSVRGLNPASDVLFNGLRVGKVRALRIWPQDSRKVEVMIWIKPDTPVRANSQASIVQTGLTAMSAVQISPGTADVALVEGALAYPYSAIAADPGTASASLLEAAPELVSNANAAFQRLNAIIADNQVSIRATVTSVERFATVLDASREDVAAIVRNTRVLSDQLSADWSQARELIASTNAAVARFDALVARNEKAIDQTLTNSALVSSTLASKSEDMAATLTNLRVLSEQLQQVSGKLDLTLDAASGLLKGTDTASLAGEMRSTVASFRELAGRLDRDLTGADGLTNQTKRSLKEFERFMREGAKAAGSMDRTLETIERNPQSLLFGGKKVPDYIPQ